jgi:multidrug efflux pump subunit AcrB
VQRIYFHPNVKIDMAVAQVTATMETSLRNMPTGMFPANVLKYDASSVPILQLGLSSKTLREQEIFDIGNNFIRTPLGTVQGASVSYPFGGKQRSVMVDLNLDELYAKQLSPSDVSNALNLQNLVLPTGTAKIASRSIQGIRSTRQLSSTSTSLVKNTSRLAETAIYYPLLPESL